MLSQVQTAQDTGVNTYGSWIDVWSREIRDLVVCQAHGQPNSQMTAGLRARINYTKGRIRYEWVQVLKDNHMFDCELMIAVAAVVTKVIQVTPRQAASFC